MSDYVLGVDIGGTSAKLGLVDAAGQILQRGQVATGRDLSGNELVQRIAEAASELTGGMSVGGLGVAAPGMRRDDGEGVINVTNLPLIDGYPLRAELERATGLRTRLDNDANAAALGEFRFGGGKDARRLMVVTLGTGIGGGMVVDGEVHRVAWGGLGDPGHVIVKPDGPVCGCGARGCVETLASVPAILRRSETFGGYFQHLAELALAAQHGHPAAMAALSEAGDLIGVALATLTHILGPDRILLGGGGMDACEEDLFDPLRASFYRHCQPFLAERLTLGRARLGNDAGVVGAAALVASL